MELSSSVVSAELDLHISSRSVFNLYAWGLELSGFGSFLTALKFKFKFIYSHLFNCNITKMRDRKEVKKNRADYTLS